MGEFFKGWRRKAGLVTLAMACVLTTGWMRSYVKQDQVCLERYGEYAYFLRSDEATLRIVWRETVLYGVNDEDVFIFPYWSLVLPLTLLSAWLILGKTRKETNRLQQDAPS